MCVCVCACVSINLGVSTAKARHVSAAERGGHVERRQCQALREDQVPAELPGHGE